MYSQRFYRPDVLRIERRRANEIKCENCTPRLEAGGKVGKEKGKGRK